MNDAGKRAAGEAAAALVEDAMLGGLGTGSTMHHAIVALGRRVAAGLRCVGVPTSLASAALARSFGIKLADPGEAALDLALDGADEVERGTLRLIKGLGGALLREKIVAEASRRFVIVADPSKLVAHLGERAPLPVEVEPFGQVATARRIAALGGRAVLRTDGGGTALRTDGGNAILDCHDFAPILDPFTLERSLRSIAGVLGTGLFLMPVEQVLIGNEAGEVEVLTG
jgi:ribose 5-phosphate isomerase A